MTSHSPPANEERACWFHLPDHRPPFPTSGPVVTTAQPPQGRVRQRPLHPSALCISKENVITLFFLFRIPLQQHQVKHKLICRHTGSTMTAAGRGQMKTPLRVTHTAGPSSGLLDPRARAACPGPVPCCLMTDTPWADTKEVWGWVAGWWGAGAGPGPHSDKDNSTPVSPRHFCLCF